MDSVTGRVGSGADADKIDVDQHEGVRVNWDIFRAYDVRGVYPTDLNEDGCYDIARGYVHVFQPKTVALGMDVRLSSPSLKEAVIRGLRDSCVDVVDIGQATTDMLYFAVGAYGYSGGIIVSASHNPPEYNGLKIVGPEAAAISSDSGLFEIRDVLRREPPSTNLPAKTGAYTQKSVLADYVEHVLGFVEGSVVYDDSFVANTNFGFACTPVREIAARLDLNILPLNFEPDGSFPKGTPDPMLEVNRKETAELVRKSGATFAVIWDADADRVMFLDEDGRFVAGVYVTALLSKIMLRNHGPDHKIIFDPRVIWPAQRAIREMGGTPVVSKGGHSFMKDRMRAEKALFGGELSGHYYFRDNFYADNGMIPFLLVLKELSRTNTKLSELVTPFATDHYVSGELNYRVKHIEEVLNRVRKRYKACGQEDFTDGYSVETDEWRLNIRASNTEPLLRLNIESLHEHLVDDLRRQVEEEIR